MKNPLFSLRPSPALLPGRPERLAYTALSRSFSSKSPTKINENSDTLEKSALTNLRAAS